jgi:hypothetical protein
MSEARAILTYEERNALEVLRKSMRRKPQIATALLEGMSKEIATNVLKQVQRELTDLLSVSQAFSAAAGALVKKEQESKDETS